MHRYHPHLWNCLHNLMIPLPLKQNHAEEALHGHIVLFKHRRASWYLYLHLLSIYLQQIMPSTLHCMHGKVVQQMGTFISIIKQLCSHCGHVYGCGTANHSSRTGGYRLLHRKETPLTCANPCILTM